MMFRSVVVIVFAGLLSACGKGPREEVVVYAALDREFSKPILDEFTARTGIAVQAVYDSESTKTVGLTNRIIGEAQRPGCDVFWNNEILNTLRLMQRGLLQPCEPTHAADYPPQYRDPDGHWHGFAARARVILVNTELVPPDQRPTSIRDLADPRWRGRIGIAKPLFGTTASHVACLFVKLGEAGASDLLAALKDNDIQVLGGNKGCAEAVGAGRLAMALTDTDDAIIELDAGKPVVLVYPDADADGMGTLVLPNTLAMIKDCPHPDAARKLIDYLLSPEVEARLAAGRSAQIPLNTKTAATSRALPTEKLHPMEVDFAAAAEAFTAGAKYIEEHFLAP